MIWGPGRIGDPVQRACLPHSELSRFWKNLMFSALGPGDLKLFFAGKICIQVFLEGLGLGAQLHHPVLA